MVTMKAMCTDGREVLCKFSRLQWEDDPDFEATICRMRHGDYRSVLAVDKSLDDLTPAFMHNILSIMVNDEAECLEEFFFLEAGYTIHTGAEPTTGP